MVRPRRTRSCATCASRAFATIRRRGHRAERPVRGRPRIRRASRSASGRRRSGTPAAHVRMAHKAVEERDGLVDKFLGDGVMALFLPVLTGEDHAGSGDRGGDEPHPRGGGLGAPGGRRAGRRRGAFGQGVRGRHRVGRAARLHGPGRHRERGRAPGWDRRAGRAARECRRLGPRVTRCRARRARADHRPGSHRAAGGRPPAHRRRDGGCRPKPVAPVVLGSIPMPLPPPLGDGARVGR